MRAGLLKSTEQTQDPREQANTLICMHSVGAALSRQAVREELLEKVWIVALGDVWMAPIGNKRFVEARARREEPTYLTRPMRFTCPVGSMPYSP